MASATDLPSNSNGVIWFWTITDSRPMEFWDTSCLTPMTWSLFACPANHFWLGLAISVNIESLFVYFQVIISGKFRTWWTKRTWINHTLHYRQHRTSDDPHDLIHSSRGDQLEVFNKTIPPVPSAAQWCTCEAHISMLQYFGGWIAKWVRSKKQDLARFAAEWFLCNKTLRK